MQKSAKNEMPPALAKQYTTLSGRFVYLFFGPLYFKWVIIWVFGEIKV
jgi:hypothetical protein